MLDEGKKRLSNYKNINWKVSRAEKIDAPNETFDYYTISFGLRNTKNLNSTISEAYRVLKKGGRFFCLEFSKIQNQNLDFIYKQYSKLIPLIGKLVVGKSAPYEYLVQSIDEFVNQEELLDLIKSKNFYNASYKNFVWRYCIFTYRLENMIFNKFFILFKIGRKIGKSNIINIVSETHKIPVFIKLFFNLLAFSFSSSNEYEK